MLFMLGCLALLVNSKPLTKKEKAKHKLQKKIKKEIETCLSQTV